uniref:Uncharacterized protein n=1 Tax=Metapenaeus joyneri majanivirus TaxID=2984280 RepID=A0A9C7C6G9_9VIRU|nr:MAG: hypothetical protein [Metapenaeus joyneri majanivirus]
MKEDKILVTHPLPGTFKSLIKEIIDPNDIFCKYPKWQSILTHHQNKCSKKFIPEEEEEKIFFENISNINIDSQTLERVYCIFSKDDDDDDYYEFWGRLKKTSSSNYPHEQITPPLYVVLQAQNTQNETTFKGTINMFIDPQIFLDYLFMSFDYKYDISISDKYIDKVWHSLKEDGILVTKPSLGMFKSLIPEITNLEDAISKNENLKFILSNQNKLEKKISPWEKDNFRDISNININPKTVNRFYYYSVKDEGSCWFMNYIFLGRLVSNYHHILGKPLYVKLEAQFNELSVYKIRGTIHITDNPQSFLNLITSSYKRNWYDSEKIWKSIKEDNINVSKPLTMTFKSLVPSIQTPDMDIGLIESAIYHKDFIKKSSPTYIDLNLSGLDIRSDNIDCIYFSSYLKEEKSSHSYQLLARLRPNHFYSKDGKPLYIHLKAHRKVREDYYGQVFMGPFTGVIYVTTCPQIFLHVMVYNTYKNKSEIIWESMKKDGIDVIKPSHIKALIKLEALIKLFKKDKELSKLYKKGINIRAHQIMQERNYHYCYAYDHYNFFSEMTFK